MTMAGHKRESQCKRVKPGVSSSALTPRCKEKKMIHARFRIRALSIVSLALAACGGLGSKEELVSSADGVSIEAQPLSVITVSVTVTPGCPTGVQTTGSIDYWCIPDTGLITLTFTDVRLPGGDLATDGTLVLQKCATGGGGVELLQPKESCTGPGGSARWITDGFFDLALVVGAPTATIDPPEISGWRLGYIPVPGSGLKRAASAAFNLDRRSTCTCPP